MTLDPTSNSFFGRTESCLGLKWFAQFPPDKEGTGQELDCAEMNHCSPSKATARWPHAEWWSGLLFSFFLGFDDLQAELDCVIQAFDDAVVGIREMQFLVELIQ